MFFINNTRYNQELLNQFDIYSVIHNIKNDITTL